MKNIKEENKIKNIKLVKAPFQRIIVKSVI